MNFLDKKLSRILIRVFQEYFESKKEKFEDEKILINFLSKLDFNTVDI